MSLLRSGDRLLERQFSAQMLQRLLVAERVYGRDGARLAKSVQQRLRFIADNPSSNIFAAR